MSNLKRLFRKVGPVAESTEFKSLRKTIFSLLEIQCRVDMEYCYYIESNSIILAEAGHQTIEIEDSSIRAIVWVIAETFEPDLLRFNKTFFCDQNE